MKEKKVSMWSSKVKNNTHECLQKNLNILAKDFFSNEEEIYKCKYCNYKSKKISNFKRHMKSKTHLKNYNIFMEENKVEIINDDIEIETREEYTCKICEYKTNDKRNFNRHNKSKNHIRKIENKKYKCDICKYETTNKYNYNKHKKSKKHLNKIKKIEKKYTCELCKYKTNKQNTYNKHLKSKVHKENTDKEIYFFICKYEIKENQKDEYEKEYNIKINDNYKCNYKTNDDDKWIEHMNKYHIHDKYVEKEKNIINNINNINNDNRMYNCHNKTINNNLNIHIEFDKKSLVESLKELSNEKFASLFMDINKDEMKINECYTTSKVLEHTMKNLMKLTIKNKLKNNSFDKLKYLDGKTLKLYDDEEKYQVCEEDIYLCKLLMNNLKMINEEHKKRLNDVGYLKIINHINEFIKDIEKELDLTNDYHYQYVETRINYCHRNGKIMEYKIRLKNR
jgi:hypothetical protein